MSDGVRTILGLLGFLAWAYFYAVVVPEKVGYGVGFFVFPLFAVLLLARIMACPKCGHRFAVLENKKTND